MMDQLASCYFCGTALEEPMDEYPIVPDELQSAPEHEQTIVLCQSCRRKLTPVVETVVDAVGEHETPTDVTTSAVEGADTSLEEADTSDSAADSADDASRDVVAPDEDTTAESESDPDAASGSSDGEAEDAGGDADTPASEDDSDGSAETAVDSETEEPDETVDADDGPEVDESADQTKDTDEIEPLPFVDDALAEGDEPIETDARTDNGETSGTSTEEQAETGTDADGDADTEDDTATATDDAEDGATDEGGSDAKDGVSAGDLGPREPSLSALEYNQVMRLLQNREFPVDRGEIESLASSAYELTPAECSKVIDVAIDRGFLREEDGQLHRTNRS